MAPGSPEEVLPDIACRYPFAEDCGLPLGYRPTSLPGIGDSRLLQELELKATRTELSPHLSPRLLAQQPLAWQSPRAGVVEELKDRILTLSHVANTYRREAEELRREHWQKMQAALEEAELQWQERATVTDSTHNHEVQLLKRDFQVVEQMMAQQAETHLSEKDRMQKELKSVLEQLDNSKTNSASMQSQVQVFGDLAETRWKLNESQGEVLKLKAEVSSLKHELQGNPSKDRLVHVEAEVDRLKADLQGCEHRERLDQDLLAENAKLTREIASLTAQQATSSTIDSIETATRCSALRSEANNLRQILELRNAELQRAKEKLEEYELRWVREEGKLREIAKQSIQQQFLAHCRNRLGVVALEASQKAKTDLLKALWQQLDVALQHEESSGEDVLVAILELVKALWAEGGVQDLERKALEGGLGALHAALKDLSEHSQQLMETSLRIQRHAVACATRARGWEAVAARRNVVSASSCASSRETKTNASSRNAGPASVSGSSYHGSALTQMAQRPAPIKSLKASATVPALTLPNRPGGTSLKALTKGSLSPRSYTEASEKTSPTGGEFSQEATPRCSVWPALTPQCHSAKSDTVAKPSETGLDKLQLDLDRLQNAINMAQLASEKVRPILQRVGTYTEEVF